MRRDEATRFLSLSALLVGRVGDRRDGEPHIGLLQILWNATPKGVSNPDVKLRLGHALFGRALVPFDRRAIVLCHSFSGIVHFAEIILRSAMALFRQLTPQSDRRRVVAVIGGLRRARDNRR